MSQKTLILKKYHRAPAGRLRRDGEFNGQRYREEFLVPALKSVDRVIVDLDDLDGVGSSFWEEAFGGLIRVEAFSHDELSKKLVLRCTDDITLVPKIKGYIQDAESESK